MNEGGTTRPTVSREEAARDLVEAVLAPEPDYPGAHVIWLRIVCTLAHRAREAGLGT